MRFMSGKNTISRQESDINSDILPILP